MNRLPPNTFAPRVQCGFTLVELLVALLIGLFLVGGLLTIVQDNRRTFSSQNQLSQLQDAERVAMTMLTDVIQSAGYFPDPTTNTAASALPIAGAINAGQPLFGQFGAAPPGDTITVRYATNSGDGIVNCIGASNTSGAQATYTNVFSVVNGQLVCTLNGTAYQLVGSVPNAAAGVLSNGIVVNNLSILYGINNGGTAGNVNTYVTANNVPSWFNVISVQVSLTFNNPLYSANPVQGQGKQPQYLTVSRVISVMNQTGI
jgi:type IV pilus assembly protein PilW